VFDDNNPNEIPARPSLNRRRVLAAAFCLPH